MSTISHGWRNGRIGTTLLASGLVCFVVASIVLAGCPSPRGTSEEGASEADEGIVRGQLDTTHTAVVALQGGCTGTVVQVKNGIGYVLTAAHCCQGNMPTNVRLSPDSASGGVLAPVRSGSVSSHPCFALGRADRIGVDRAKNDLCMLQFNAPPGTLAIPVATPGQDDDALANGETVEFVGYGRTRRTDTSNTQRRTGRAPIVPTSIFADTFQTDGTPPNANPCRGDSGGPALVPAGAPQGQQTVIGVVSFGNCRDTETFMRVSAESGPFGFIDDYLNDRAHSAACPCKTDCSASAQQRFKAQWKKCQRQEGKPRDRCLKRAATALLDETFRCACPNDTGCVATPSPGPRPDPNRGTCCPPLTVAGVEGTCCPPEQIANGSCCPPPGQIVNGACLCGGALCPSNSECLACANLPLQCTPRGTQKCLSCNVFTGAAFETRNFHAPRNAVCCGTAITGQLICDQGCTECPNPNPPPGQLIGICGPPPPGGCGP